MSQALYRKWRPARFDDVVGQEHITHTLRQAGAAGRVGHAYLFCGPRGTGKTTTARLLAKAVNCLDHDAAIRPCGACSICKTIGEGRFLDLIEIDAASNTGVDDIRDLRDKINFAPSEGRYKVYIIDEVHMLSTAAFNALLKTLEEPPPHAIFILATTEEHKVPLTIKSRCQQFNFRLLTQPEIVSRLTWLAQREKLTIEPEALAMIAQHGAGSLRDAESLLDQLVTAPDDVITLARAQMVLGTASSTAVKALAEAWLNGEGPAGLGVIHRALASGADARQFCRQMVTYLRQLLLLQTAGPELALDVPTEQKAAMLAQARQADRHGLIEAVKRFNEAAVTPAISWQPQLPLELAFIQLLPESTAGTPAMAPAMVAPAMVAPAMVAPTPVATTTAPVQATPVKTAAPPPVEVAPAETAVVASSPPGTTPAAGSNRLTLDMVKSQWPKIATLIGQQNKNLRALLNSCKPLGAEGDVLILGFDFPILKDKFDKTPQARDIVANVLGDVLGVQALVRSVLVSDYTPPAAPTVTVNKEDFQALAQELGGIVRD
jgi:DNA polymerase III subunit gamma/tau